jgi:type I restriction-modification system DNA methylase subunit
MRGDTKHSAFTPIDEAKTSFRTEFQTPVHVAKYMVKMIPDGCVSILEPTPGIGRIVKEISRKAKYEITAPDDFFLLTPRRFDCVVMNPPFSTKWCFLDNAPVNFNQTGMRLGYWMLTECMKMSDHVIALMPWFTISDSDLRLRTLNNFGIKSITALPRDTFAYARIQTCVLELHKGWAKPSEFKVFRPTSKAQLSLHQ